MSVHIEWTSTDHPFFGVTVLGPGYDIRQDDWENGESDVADVTTAESTLVISADDVLVIEGDLEWFLAAVQKAIDTKWVKPTESEETE